ncbi:MAG: hypothetical protein RL368_605 [Pseudomonadota bacterium]|jgi:hypothetical protein
MCHFYKLLRLVLLSLTVASCAYYTPAPSYYGGGYYGGYVSPSISIFTPIFPIFAPYRGYYGRGWWGGYRHHR